MSVPNPLLCANWLQISCVHPPLNVSQGTQTQLSHNVPHAPQPLLPVPSFVGSILFLFTHPQHLEETSLLPSSQHLTSYFPSMN